MLRPAFLLAALVPALTLWTPASASADSSHASHHIKVDFPKGSPGHNHGGTAEIDICPFNSFDDLQNHFDSDKTSKYHDAIDAAFEDAIKTDGKTKDNAFDLRHKNCPHHDSHDSSSAHHTQTKVIPKGSVDAGDGSTEQDEISTYRSAHGS